MVSDGDISHQETATQQLHACPQCGGGKVGVRPGELHALSAERTTVHEKKVACTWRSK